MKLDILDAINIILSPFYERDWNSESARNNALFK